MSDVGAGGHNFERLRDAIIDKSRSKVWDQARLEWKLLFVTMITHRTCLCGHSPITEICTIGNHLTHERADVGNVCVKRFMGIRSDLVFAALRRIRRDLNSALNFDALYFFHDTGVINKWEYDFGCDTSKKRVLSGKQLDARRSINQKVLNSVARPLDAVKHMDMATLESM